MKFAFCLYKYFPYGGLQRDFMRFLEEAQTRGHEIQVYCISWQGDMPAGLNVNFVPAKAFSNHRRNEKFSHLVRKAIEESPVDVVVGFNKMPGLDVYYAADSCYEAKAQTERNWLYRLGGRYRHFSHYEQEIFLPEKKVEILLISETEKAKFIKYYQTPEQRMHMLPPGISKDRCAPDNAAEIRAEFREEFDLADDDVLLLFVGSGFITKGLDRAIKSLASLPKKQREQTFLYVVGQDNPKHYKALAKKLDVLENIKFLGGRDDVLRFLLGADYLLHLALVEAAGAVLLEALVAGLPVLVTDVCGYAHHINSAKAGHVISAPFDQIEFNKILPSIIDNVAERQRWSENALKYARDEDLYSMHSRGIDIMESLAMDIEN